MYGVQDVYQQVANLFTRPQADPLLAALNREVERGYCYLELFTPSVVPIIRQQLDPVEHQSRIGAVLYAHRTWASPLHFKLTLTRPPGFPKENYLAHIEVVNQHESAMTWEEVLNAVPYHTYFGMPEQQPSEVLLRDAQVSIPNPLVRIFHTGPVQLTYGTVVRHSNHDWCVGAAFKWTKLFPLITVRNLRVHFAPSAKASQALVQLRTCWTGDEISDWSGSVSSKNYAIDYPSFEVHTLGPPSQGGLASSLTITCPFDAENSRQYKPSPNFGKCPNFYYWYTTSKIGDAQLQPYVEATKDTKAIEADLLYELFFTFEFDATPTQPMA